MGENAQSNHYFILYFESYTPVSAHRHSQSLKILFILEPTRVLTFRRCKSYCLKVTFVSGGADSWISWIEKLQRNCPMNVSKWRVLSSETVS